MSASLPPPSRMARIALDSVRRCASKAVRITRELRQKSYQTPAELRRKSSLRPLVVEQRWFRSGYDWPTIGQIRPPLVNIVPFLPKRANDIGNAAVLCTSRGEPSKQTRKVPTCVYVCTCSCVYVYVCTCVTCRSTQTKHAICCVFPRMEITVFPSSSLVCMSPIGPIRGRVGSPWDRPEVDVGSARGRVGPSQGRFGSIRGRLYSF